METKPKIHSFTDLEAWKKAHALVVSIYLRTKKYPKDEQFGITNQMRRAAVSITSNIAEGFSRISPKEKAQFYAIAQGSLTELQNQLLISRDVGYITPIEHQEIESQLVTVHKLISGMSRYVRNLVVFLVFPLILSTIYLIPSAAHAALTDGLVGYWTLDGKNTNWATGQTLDSSGQGNTGQLIKMSTSTSPVFGKMGQAFTFNGTTQYISMGAGHFPFSKTTPFSGSAWIKSPDTASHQGPIVSDYNSNSSAGWYFGVGSGSARRIDLDIVDAAYGAGRIRYGTTNVEDARWHFVAFSYDGSNAAAGIKLYVDGAPESMTTLLDTDPGTLVDSGFIVDAYLSGGSVGSTLYATVDDVRVYNRVLSQQEITQLYKQGAAKLGVSPKVNPGQGLSNGLVGYWTFDGKSTNWVTGTTNDLSGNGNNGSLINMSTSTSPAIGKVGQALKFDGATNYVSVADNSSLDPTAAISYGGWIYVPSTPASTQMIFAKSSPATSGYGIAITSDPKFCLEISTGALSSQIHASGIITTGVWHHVMVTYNSATSKIYVDGVSQSFTASANCTNTSNAGTISQDTSPLIFGSKTGSSQFFSGNEDDIRIYNRALSAAEVLQLYKQSASKYGVSPTVNAGQGLNSGLVGYWTFDGKDTNWRTGTTTDRSGSGNTGQLINMSTTTSIAIGQLGQAFTLNGSTAYVSVGAATGMNFSKSTPFSGAAWVKTTTTLEKSIASNWDLTVNPGWQFGIGTFTVGRPILILADTLGVNILAGEGNVAVNNGQWHHVAFTYSGSAVVSGIKIYVDGLSQSVTDQSTGTADPGVLVNDGFEIGARNYASGPTRWSGSLDDVRIYNRVLSAAEVLQLYKQGANKTR